MKNLCTLNFLCVDDVEGEAVVDTLLNDDEYEPWQILQLKSDVLNFITSKLILYPYPLVYMG